SNDGARNAGQRFGQGRVSSSGGEVENGIVKGVTAGKVSIEPAGGTEAAVGELERSAGDDGRAGVGVADAGNADGERAGAGFREATGTVEFIDDPKGRVCIYDQGRAFT